MPKLPEERDYRWHDAGSDAATSADAERATKHHCQFNHHAGKNSPGLSNAPYHVVAI